MCQPTFNIVVTLGLPLWNSYPCALYHPLFATFILSAIWCSEQFQHSLQCWYAETLTVVIHTEDYLYSVGMQLKDQHYCHFVSGPYMRKHLNEICDNNWTKPHQMVYKQDIQTVSFYVKSSQQFKKTGLVFLNKKKNWCDGLVPCLDQFASKFVIMNEIVGDWSKSNCGMIYV